VRLFYSLLPQRHRWVEAQSQAAEFIIDETFGVPGVGTVVAGACAGTGRARVKCVCVCVCLAHNTPALHGAWAHAHSNPCMLPVLRASPRRRRLLTRINAGTVKRGVITPNTNLLLGPDVGDGSFKPAAIKSIVSCPQHAAAAAAPTCCRATPGGSTSLCPSAGEQHVRSRHQPT
jgi:hypothetical protein